MIEAIAILNKSIKRQKRQLLVLKLKDVVFFNKMKKKGVSVAKYFNSESIEASVRTLNLVKKELAA